MSSMGNKGDSLMVSSVTHVYHSGSAGAFRGNPGTWLGEIVRPARRQPLRSSHVFGSATVGMSSKSVGGA